jgi:hypothetical protein
LECYNRQTTNLNSIYVCTTSDAWSCSYISRTKVLQPWNPSMLLRNFFFCTLLCFWYFGVYLIPCSIRNKPQTNGTILPNMVGLCYFFGTIYFLWWLAPNTCVLNVYFKLILNFWLWCLAPQNTNPCWIGFRSLHHTPWNFTYWWLTP